MTYQAAFNQSNWRQQAKSARFKDPIQGGLEGIRMWGRQCNLLLSDSDIVSQLKVSRYNKAETSAIGPSSCCDATKPGKLSTGIVLACRSGTGFWERM